MPKWEVCRIQQKHASGTLWSGPGIVWCAMIDTVQGPKELDRTLEIKPSSEGWKNNEEEYSKLVSRLLENAWEPVAFASEGKVIVLERQTT